MLNNLGLRSCFSCVLKTQQMNSPSCSMTSDRMGHIPSMMICVRKQIKEQIQNNNVLGGESCEDGKDAICGSSL